MYPNINISSPYCQKKKLLKVKKHALILRLGKKVAFKSSNSFSKAARAWNQALNDVILKNGRILFLVQEIRVPGNMEQLFCYKLFGTYDTEK